MTTEAPEKPTPVRTRAKKGEATPVTRPYVVLRLDPTAIASGSSGTGAWVEIGTFVAATDEAAIDDAIAEDDEGTFVAVSGRYWNPKTPNVEVKRTRSWTPAS